MDKAPTCFKCFSMKEINKQMTILDNIKEHLTTQKYLDKCNEISKEFKVMNTEKCICSLDREQQVAQMVICLANYGSI